jgi:hypothetical protein
VAAADVATAAPSAASTARAGTSVVRATSYIPKPCGTPSVLYASFFQVVSPSDIISKWLISTWCQQGREVLSPGGMQ